MDKDKSPEEKAFLARIEESKRQLILMIGKSNMTVPEYDYLKNIFAEVDVYLRPWLTPDGKPVELTYQMMVEKGLVKPYTYKVTCVDKDGNETSA